VQVGDVACGCGVEPACAQPAYPVALHPLDQLPYVPGRFAEPGGLRGVRGHQRERFEQHGRESRRGPEQKPGPVSLQRRDPQSGVKSEGSSSASVIACAWLPLDLIVQRFGPTGTPWTEGPSCPKAICLPFGDHTG
jgi:hypothetical protein